MNDRASATLDRSSGGFDVLSDVLRAVRLRGAVYFDVHAASPWVAESPHANELEPLLMPGAGQVIPFHVLAAGACTVELPGREACPMSVGDVVVFPRGDAHVLSSARGMRAPVDSALYQRAGRSRLPVRVKPGPGGASSAHLVCGFLSCDARPFNPLLESLPDMLLVSCAEANWFGVLVDTAVRESREPAAGGETLLSRLSELLFVEALRRFAARGAGQNAGWLAALREPEVGRALALMHAEPALPWTLALLARRCGLSRSVLAERFSRLAGLPPMQYLARWRLQLAAQLLAEGDRKVATVAREVGYDSEAAFSRAFKRHAGVAPALWRRGAPGARARASR